MEDLELYVSKSVREKLRIHHVLVLEVEEALCLYDGVFLIDDRPKHKTIPPTIWFIGPTFDDRLLKISMMIDKVKQRIVLKTAYDPSEQEIALYEEST